MIQLSRNYSLPEKKEDDLAIKIIGVGGAGANALDRIVLDGMEHAEMIAVNTDVQSLASSVATHKVQIGREVTRGLGAGGDPELGYNAAKNPPTSCAKRCKARGWFSSAPASAVAQAPVRPHAWRNGRAKVDRWSSLLPPCPSPSKASAAPQAMEALHELQRVSDAVVCFENDRMGDIVLPKAGIHQAFAVADTTISQSVRAIVNVVRRPGLIQIGFDELLSALRSQNSRCLFGFGESDSDNRAHEALALALKNPLMNRGKMLTDARPVLVQISGGPGMTLTEVEIVMQELNRHVEDHTQILFGTSVDGKMGNRMSVTLISSLSADGAIPPAPMRPLRRMDPAPPPTEPMETSPAPPPALEVLHAQQPDPPEAPMTLEVEEEESVSPVAATSPLPPLVRKERKQPVARESKGTPEPAPTNPPPVKKDKSIHVRQEVMQFEPVTRGRFEKSEPTIVEGQDLDVPTFLRKNVRVK